MWPRTLFQKKDEMGRLLIVQHVDELQLPGVYVLYIGQDPYYVGNATRLLSRLHSHANKSTARYYEHWDHFSAFVLTGKVRNQAQRLMEVESILIAGIPRLTNKSTPRFKLVRIPKALRLG
jgi:hypothetical protein